MQLLNESVKIDTRASKVSGQAMVEGRIAPPSSQPVIDDVLSMTTRVSLTGAEPQGERIVMEGRVHFNVIYTGEGAVWAFESSAPFKHAMELDSALDNAHLSSRAVLSGSQYELEGAALRVTAAIVLECDVETSGEMELLLGAEGLKDLQTLGAEAQLPAMVASGGASALVREEVVLAQGLPACTRLLSTNASVRRLDSSCEEGKLVVEGEVIVVTTYLCDDPAAPIQQVANTLPLGHMLMLRGAQPGMTARATAKVTEVYAKTSSEDGSPARSLGYELVVQIDAKVYTSRSVSVIYDAYTPGKLLGCERTDIEMQRYHPDIRGESSHRFSVRQPRDMAGARVLATFATPVVSMTTPVQDGLKAEGVVFARLLYINREGVLMGADVEAPFIVELDARGLSAGALTELELAASGATSQVMGEDVELKVVFGYCIGSCFCERMSVLTSMTELEGEVTPQRGITLYFASEGERLWNIAKRFSTTVDAIRRYNPAISGDSVAGGDKLILYRPGA